MRDIQCSIEGVQAFQSSFQGLENESRGNVSGPERKLTGAKSQAVRTGGGRGEGISEVGCEGVSSD